MPPYKLFVSDAQRGKLNAMASRGEISKKEVEGKNKASKGMNLPARTTPMRNKIFGGSK